MGIVRQEIKFDGQVPDLPRIAAKMTELCGLPVTVTESDVEIKGDLYDMHGQLAFASVPEEQVTVSVYKPGTVRQFFQDTHGEMELPTSQVVGSNEADGTQTVHLQGYIAMEPTLWEVAVWALETLGGRSRQPTTSEEVQEYRQLLTADELRERQRLVRKTMRNTMLLGCLLMPCLIPLWILVGLWTMLSFSLGIGKAGRMYREVKRQMRDDEV